MRKAYHEALVARAKALPEGKRLAYISCPTPNIERWVFADGTVCTGAANAAVWIGVIEGRP